MRDRDGATRVVDSGARADIVAAIRGALDLPGVELDRMTSIDALPLPDGGWRVQSWASAWGPGLHQMRVCWRIDLAPYLHTRIPLLRALRLRALRANVRAAYRTHILRQQARASRAATLGIEAPLHLPSAAVAAATPGTIRTDHLVIERFVLFQMVAAISAASKTPHAAIKALRQQIAHDAASAYETDLVPTVHVGDNVRDDGAIVRGKNVLRELPVMMREIRTPGGTESVLQPYMPFGTGKPAATFDGTHLLIVAPIPETLVTAAIGRTIGEIVATGTDLDHRKILDVQIVGNVTALTTTMDAVRVSDLPNRDVTRADITAMPSVTA